MSQPDLLMFDVLSRIATAEATRLGHPMVISRSPGAWHVRNAGTPALPGFVEVASITPGARAGEGTNRAG